MYYKAYYTQGAFGSYHNKKPPQVPNHINMSSIVTVSVINDTPSRLILLCVAEALIHSTIQQTCRLLVDSRQRCWLPAVIYFRVKYRDGREGEEMGVEDTI